MIELLTNPIDAMLDLALLAVCCAVPVCLGIGAGAIHHAYESFFNKGRKQH